MKAATDARRLDNSHITCCWNAENEEGKEKC